jgi:hypothetical protein
VKEEIIARGASSQEKRGKRRQEPDPKLQTGLGFGLCGQEDAEVGSNKEIDLKDSDVE